MRKVTVNGRANIGRLLEQHAKSSLLTCTYTKLGALYDFEKDEYFKHYFNKFRKDLKTLTMTIVIVLYR